MERGLAILSSLLSLMLASQVLTEEGFGIFTLNLAFYSLLIPFIALGLSSILVPEFIENKNTKQIYYSTTVARIICWSFMLVIFLIIKKSFSDNLGSFESLSFLVFLGLAGYCFHGYDSLNQATNKTHLTFLSRFISFFIFLLPKIYLFKAGQASVSLILIIFFFEALLAQLIGFCISMPKQRKPLYLEKKLPFRLLNNGKFFLAASILEIVSLRIDQFLIVFYLGVLALGSYALGARLAGFSIILGSVAAAASFPEIFASRNNSVGLFKKYRTLNAVLFVFGLINCLVMFIALPFLFPLLFDEKLSSSIPLAQGLSVVSIIHFIRVGVSKWILVSENYELIFLSYSTSLVVGLIGNLLLLKNFGVWGAVFASFFACSAGFLSLLITSSGREYLRYAFFARPQIVKNSWK